MWRSSEWWATSWWSVRTTTCSSHEVPEEWVSGTDILLEVSLGIWDIFVDDAENGFGSLFGLDDLEHGVIVASSFLAILTEVIVLADRALVSNPNDGLHATAVALHSPVLSLWLSLSLFLFDLFGDFRTVHEVLKDLLLLLLKLSLDQFLENFFGEASVLVLLGTLGLNV